MAVPQISGETLLEDFQLLDTWEEKYRYIIELGQKLPQLSDEYKTNENLVRGCQSRVWVISESKNGPMSFLGDSDALIVKGLVAIVLGVFEGQEPDYILNYDLRGLFSKLDLEQHLSVTRANGLNALINKVKNYASVNLELNSERHPCGD